MKQVLIDNVDSPLGLLLATLLASVLMLIADMQIAEVIFVLSSPMALLVVMSKIIGVKPRWQEVYLLFCLVIILCAFPYLFI